MGALYRAGESKIRPGVYRRYENVGTSSIPGAVYGLFAVTVTADFGPLDTVSTFEPDQINELKEMYGTSGTVDAALALFDGGATKVHVYRLGSGGTVATGDIKTSDDAVLATVSTKYPTAGNYNITIKEKLDDATVKQIVVYLDTTLLETIEYAVSEDEKDAIVSAINADSKYLSAKAGEGTGAATAVANSALTGGTAPTVNTESYSAAFTAFEAFKWNMMVLDTTDTAVHAL